jgi:hypothetical protein
LFFLGALWAPPISAAELVNINTADKATLETLPGVGPSIAQSIIDNRPYATIQEISKANGIGEPGSSSYEKIKDSITVSGGQSTTTPPPTQNNTQSPTQTQTQTQPQGEADKAPTLSVKAKYENPVMAGGGSYFSAEAFLKAEVPLQGARFIWNFGDGKVAEGVRVFHTYSYPGKYSASVTASYNFSAGVERFVVEAQSAQVRLEVVGDGSLLIYNDSSADLTIGLWALREGEKSYLIPEDTIILGAEGVRFSSAVTGLAGSSAARLHYPNGTTAADATLSEQSPMRGERVSASHVQSFSSVATANAEPSITKTQVAAAAEVSEALLDQDSNLALWGSLAALGVLLTGGVVGVRRLASRRSPETQPVADDFEIEE